MPSQPTAEQVKEGSVESYPPLDVLQRFDELRPFPARSYLPAFGGLEGAKIYRMGDGHAIVPLLLPDRDGLPIALGLELLGFKPAMDNLGPRSRPVVSASYPESVREIHYVLDGEGEVVGRRGKGPRTHAHVASGDTFMVQPGTTRLLRHSGGAASDTNWSMASLVVLMDAGDPYGPAGGSDGASAGSMAPGGSDSLPLDALFGSLDELLGKGEIHEAGPRPGHSRFDAGRRSSRMPGSLSVHQVAMAQWLGGECLGVLSWDDLSSMLLKASLSVSKGYQPAAGQKATGLPATHVVSPPVPPPSPSPSSSSHPPGHVDPKEAIAGLLSGLTGFGAALTAAFTAAAAASSREPGSCLLKRTLSELEAFEFPQQTNRLALVFDPLAEKEEFRTLFTFGVEVFEPGHITPPHLHPNSHELFFIMSGSGMAFCDGRTWPVGPGDAVVFPPFSVHGINIDPASRLYCLELMLPRDGQAFAQHVRSGQKTGALKEEDLCNLISMGCGSPQADTVLLDTAAPGAAGGDEEAGAA